ncbi:MAG TPA: FAD-dependent oxidoreductase [Firmicutes bacterium]|jgi:hypothetical protein|nr:FAD-dependent oxidoreductase [Bacillota bacterium]
MTVLRASDGVIICGAGPSGTAAAIAAARQGVKTYLIERSGSLGGTWTNGLLCKVLDAENKGGIMSELVAHAQNANALGPDYVFDPEVTKYALERMCLEAGVEIRYHTQLVGVETVGNRIAAVVTESKSGREKWPGTVFVDGTGDGDLGALAGCSFEVGRGNREVQPASLEALITGISPEDVSEYLCNGPCGPEPAKQNLLRELERAGHSPSYSKPIIFHIREDLFALHINHQYFVQADDADGISQATLLAREELHRAVECLRSLGGIWSGLRLLWTSDFLGIREGRRIRGLYYITIDDLLAGREHYDDICKVSFGVDVHSPDPDRNKGAGNEGFAARPYGVPLRALIAQDMENLILSGRCISGDFLSHSSYRVVGNAVQIGEAAGVLAALSVKEGIAPQDVNYAAVQELLG